MASTGRWLGAFLNRIKDPTNRKRVWAILGATVILGTFLVKDVKRDNLKELVDSIVAAENTYLIRTEDRRNYDEFKRFEKEFAEFRKHPTTPVIRSGGGSGDESFNLVGDGEIDWEAFNTANEEQTANNELLDNVIRLSDKLPDGAGKKELEANDKENDKFAVEMRDIQARGWKLQPSAKEHVQEINGLNKQIGDHILQISAISEATNKLSFTILQNAGIERKKDEWWFEIWTWIFYGLYVIGWVIGIGGILMEEGEKGDVLKEITEL